jgi:hypothetical protein
MNSPLAVFPLPRGDCSGAAMQGKLKASPNSEQLSLRGFDAVPKAFSAARCKKVTIKARFSRNSRNIRDFFPP